MVRRFTLNCFQYNVCGLCRREPSIQVVIRNHGASIVRKLYMAGTAAVDKKTFINIWRQDIGNINARFLIKVRSTSW